MVKISGFGGADSTTAETVGEAKLYRSAFEGRLRKNAYVRQRVFLASDERRHFMTAVRVGDDYRASLAMFLTHPLSDKQLAKEARRAEGGGLGFEVVNTVVREDIEGAAPPALTINMGGGWYDRPNEYLVFQRLAQLVGA